MPAPIWRIIAAEDYFNRRGSIHEALQATHWPRHAQRFIPEGIAPSLVAMAEVNAGRWIVRCPFCPSAQFASRDDRRFFCVECLNQEVGGAYLRVTWPRSAIAIETILAKRPHPNFMNWLPSETVADLRRENAEHGVG